MEKPLLPATPGPTSGVFPDIQKGGPATLSFRLTTWHMGLDLRQELGMLKERDKEDKRLKEKFPKINGEPTWLLRHIEVLQEQYAKDGWEYEIVVPKECRHRLYPSIIGAYLIFTREKKGRKGKVTKEYIPVPLSNGASWGIWKPMDDDVRPPIVASLSLLPPLESGKRSSSILDLDTYLDAGEYEEDFEEDTNGISDLPEHRSARRTRVVSHESSSSSGSSSGKASAYTGSSIKTAATSIMGGDIMSLRANYAPERALRSTKMRKISNISASTASTHDSSSPASLMSNGMPVPGSVRKAKSGERSDSEGLEEDPDDGDDEDEEEDDRVQTPKLIYGKTDHAKSKRDSYLNDEEEQIEYLAGTPRSIKAKRGLSDMVDIYDIEDEDADDDGLPKFNTKARYGKKLRSAVIEISDEDDEDVSPEPARKSKAVHGKYPRSEAIEILESDDEADDESDGDNVQIRDEVEVEAENYDEDMKGDEDEVADDEWFDESGYCKYCDLHQHECECIREEDKYPLVREDVDDEDYMS